MTNNVVPIHSRQQPIGTFHAVSCRDAASLERDGQPFYERNDLPTAVGRPLVEIRFADGEWLLADPTVDLVPGFYPEALSDRTFLARSYGEPWNGWATPVVCRNTLADILLAMDVPHRWTGDAVHVEDEDDAGGFLLLGPDRSRRLRPRVHGLDVHRRGMTSPLAPIRFAPQLARPTRQDFRTQVLVDKEESPL